MPSLLLVSLLIAQASVGGGLPSRRPDGCVKTTVAILSVFFFFFPLSFLFLPDALVRDLDPADGDDSGGGMAGITAAQALANASVHDFIILEYQDRIGGRAKHTDFGAGPDGSPYTVELGANWIQGLGKPGGPENPIWTLAKKHKLKSTTNDYKSIKTYNETGPFDFLPLLADFDAAKRRMNVAAGRMLAENLQDQSARVGLALGGWSPKHSDMAAQAAEFWSWDWEAAYPPEQSSMMFGTASDNLTFSQFSEENNLVVDQRGYDAIIHAEASTFLTSEDARLQLKKHITNIAYSNDSVVITSDDGSCVEAAYAICTFSLGVLQSDAIKFQPALPAWKQAAIRSFSMGTYTKVFMQFNETFWPQDGQQFMLYASPTTRGHYPVWQSLDVEGFMPGSHILFATATHDESYRIEQQSDAETQAEALAVLGQMFPDIKIPEPTGFMYPRWTKTPWARGSYSNWPVGTTLEMHQNLRANVGRLWFAGEAISAQYFGFLHGAWFEGREAGAHVAQFVGGSRCLRLEGEKEICGSRPHYETLHGTSPLEHYTLLNGWAARGYAASLISRQATAE
ncbi:hypothetical protein XA68_17604 [Ophiocordyceps unilateralis]|uniref:Amine oxidase domain-containing protein n=1 Tax=Ophiocordyceps unilateralis TaxID=268505 RepID=A0A2A9PIN5_OPHUN|nr:hypothetical protein XA68_17604 [Ophiocordyceps unilateralis]